MNDVAGSDFVHATTGYWQSILPADDAAGEVSPPYRFGYPARLPDGRILVLPLRRLPHGQGAVASLIANQASFDVVDTLTGFMAAAARASGADAVVGMPTLGLAFAPGVAQRLGHPNYVPLGYSRKFWYRDELSQPVRSVTTPDQLKSVYVDPNLLPRLRGRRVVVVDDAVSTGSTLLSVLALLARLECEIAAVAVAMLQGVMWHERVGAAFPALAGRVHGVIAGPLFDRVDGGWTPRPGTLCAGRGA